MNVDASLDDIIKTKNKKIGKGGLRKTGVKAVVPVAGKRAGAGKQAAKTLHVFRKAPTVRSDSRAL